MGGVFLLNLLITKTESLHDIFTDFIDWGKYGTTTDVNNFIKLPYKNSYDIDFIIADIETIVKNNYELYLQMVEKDLATRLIVVGEAKKNENLSYVLCNGIKGYFSDYEKAKIEIVEIFERRIADKQKERLFAEHLIDGSVVKKVKQALEKGDSRFLQKNLVLGSKVFPVNISLLKGYYSLIVKTVFEFAEEKGVRHIEKKDILAELLQKNDFESLKDYAVKKITGIIHLVEMNKKNQNKMVAEYIKDYVDENYMKQDTNAGNIAERFGVSSSYIGALFKEQQKTTITKYITQLRISKAAELLTGTKLQIQLISKKVGYSDQNYFARIFKKQTGLSPGEYRSNSNSSQ